MKLESEVTKDIKTEEMVLNLGPQHPSTHGVFRLVLTLDGEKVVASDPVIGYLHRGMEKLAENRTYPQVMSLFDRLDYLASFNNELGFAIAVEKLMGIEVPERAEYIRVIFAELYRITSHLMYIGTYGADLGAITPIFYTFREREYAQRLVEMVSGGRMHINYCRFGGVARDITPEFIQGAREFVRYFLPRVDEYERLLIANEIFLARTKGIGILPAEDALDYGVTGPNLRASGMRYDIRKAEPYSAYSKVKFEIPVGKVGDSWDRAKMRVEEMKQSALIIRQCLEQIPEGPFRAEGVKRIVRPPEGEVFVKTENPRGELGYYVISDGSPRPYRVKIRGPSFVNLMALPQMLKENTIPNVIAILASIDILLGEIDR